MVGRTRWSSQVRPRAPEELRAAAVARWPLRCCHCYWRSALRWWQPEGSAEPEAELRRRSGLESAGDSVPASMLSESMLSESMLSGAMPRQQAVVVAVSGMPSAGPVPHPMWTLGPDVPGSDVPAPSVSGRSGSGRSRCGWERASAPKHAELLPGVPGHIARRPVAAASLEPEGPCRSRRKTETRRSHLTVVAHNPAGHSRRASHGSAAPEHFRLGRADSTLRDRR